MSSRRPLKVAVCIKQVPVVSMLRFDNETRRLVREGVPNEVNPFDVLGMSAVANLKQAMPLEAVVLTMGPPQAREALLQCLAMGADRAVHLVDRAFAGSDTLATARALAMALRREEPDLVVCGRNSVDAETGQVGPEVAELLGLPQITGARKLEVNDSARAITAERLTDEGYDVVRCPLPALVTVTEDVAPAVYPRREAIEAARVKPVAELKAADLSPDTTVFGQQGSPTWVDSIYSVEPHREGVVVRDKPAQEAVALLLDYLERRGVLDGSRSSAPPGNPRGPRRERGRRGAIWVLAEILGGEVRHVTLELLGRACELAPKVDTSVEAALIGHNVEGHAAALTAYGADRVHLADDQPLAHYDTELYTAILAEAIKEQKPYAVLMPSTVNGRDLASRLAARIGLGLTGDCIGLEVDGEGRLVQLKPAFGGNIVAPILSRTMPQMATVRPGILTPAAPDWTIGPAIETIQGPSPRGQPRVQVLRRVVDSSAEGTELERARIIVSVGKGVGSPENINVVRELADVLGAALGATRDVTDAGWLPRQFQIGLSGKSVSPELYIAVAVRGPFNHTVGIQKARTVVAINNNARAPIFKAADFGIVGDYAEVVPELTRAIKQRGN
jgi:electron transfer flavoprotein alpha subunit